MENTKKNNVAEQEKENETHEVVETKTKRKLRFQNPFKVEKIEVPVKAKKEKPDKSEKAEKPKSNGFAKGFAAGLAAGSAMTAGAGIFGAHLRKSSENVSEDSDQDEDLEFDENAETSEDSEETPEE